MSKNFLKFKKRLSAMRIVRSVMAGFAAALTLGGVMLVLTKLNVIGLPPIASLYFGLGGLLLVGGLFFLFGGKKDSTLARELDETFGLHERVQTMIEFGGEEGEMLTLQRQDTDDALSKIPAKAYKFKSLPIYIICILLSCVMMCGGILAPDMRGYVPPEEIKPFKLTEVQAARLNELIAYVENSALEEQFKTPMADELRSLLSKLREITTEPDMQVTLAESMAVIVNITYESSTATEMLNALWNTGDIHLRYLARVLDTSSQNKPDWGEYAEKLSEYIGILMGENNKKEDEKKSAEDISGVAALKWAIENMTRKLGVALDGSGLSEEDEMYSAVYGIFNDQSGGLATMMTSLDTLSDEEARELLESKFNITSEKTFAAISLNKNNASVGEYVMTCLASMFPVPVPEFERPEFFKTGEMPDGSHDSSSDDDKEGTQDGGIGEGIIFGSKDPVLDPKTGKYVEYGDLIYEYNTIMFERLQGDYYTEEQKKIIQKYFALLYGGLEEEGK